MSVDLPRFNYSYASKIVATLLASRQYNARGSSVKRMICPSCTVSFNPAVVTTTLTT